MLAHMSPASDFAVGFLILSFILVLAFEATNGFHDTANAVATVIYTNSLKPGQAVVLSGIMNFIGVVVGGIAVAYALVELMPPDVLSPPNGAPAIPMLISLFVAALFWNLLTWAFGLPNSSSHCLIGSLVGIAIGDCFVHARDLSEGVDWGQVMGVLRALAISPVLGFVLAGALFWVMKATIHDKELYKAPEGDKPPVWWMRVILVLTCSGVSFSHGTNDGQKSIGMIMLAVIGLLPAAFALNPEAGLSSDMLHQIGSGSAPLIQQYGDDQKAAGMQAAQYLQTATVPSPTPVGEAASGDATSSQRAAAATGLRNAAYTVMAELKHVAGAEGISAKDKADATSMRKKLADSVEYAPWWVRILSAFCLGIGTMVGYQRVVHTLGGKIGKKHLTPAQGATSELVGAVLIGTAGFTGLPVSTTHIMSSGITGTMVAGKSGLQWGTISKILLAWVFTLPATMLISSVMFYLLAARL